MRDNFCLSRGCENVHGFLVTKIRLDLRQITQGEKKKMGLKGRNVGNKLNSTQPDYIGFNYLT